jgi:hypothetical protein
MLNVLLKFSQNRPKKILFSSRLKKGQEKAKWPNHFISRKLFKKGQMATMLLLGFSQLILVLFFVTKIFDQRVLFIQSEITVK